MRHRLGIALAAMALLAGCAGPASMDVQRTEASRLAGPGDSGSSPFAASDQPVASDGAASSPAGAAVPGTPEAVATGLTSPWGLDFLPSGDAIVTSRDSGVVSRITPAGEIDQITATGDDGAVPGVAHGGEGGLLGIAVPPGWADGDPIYLYRTTADGNEVIAAPLTGDALGEPSVILAGIPASGNHNGGQLAFGPDGDLYVTTGDAGDRDSAQDPTSLAGKILRVDRNGEPAAGNPDPTSPVWSLGHRNVQGIDWADDGRMFASEFGQDTVDELNQILPGDNYGWPLYEGAADVTGYEDPLTTWPPADASPAGLAVAGGAVWLAALRGERLWRVDPSAQRADAFLVGDYGRLRAVKEGPDGALWILTNNTDGRGAPRDGDDKLLRVPLA